MKNCLINCFLFAFLGFSGCGPSSSQDFHREGNAISRSLIDDLNKIETKDDLVKSSSRLKKKMNQLTKLMIKAHLFHQKNPQEENDLDIEDQALSDSLKFHLERIYQIEGASKIIESNQEEALEMLDHYEKKQSRKKL